MKKMKKTIKLMIALFAIVLLGTGCSENYSNADKIGTITSFAKTGVIFKSYEGHLNVTQTGMNSSTGFDFSIDNDHEPDGIIAKLDSASSNGWKVKILYHQTNGWNWFGNRGHTNCFVTDIQILDKNFDDPFGIKQGNKNGNHFAKDTAYMIMLTPADLKPKTVVPITLATDTTSTPVFLKK